MAKSRPETKSRHATIDPQAGELLDRMVADLAQQGQNSTPGRVMSQALIVFYALATGAAHLENGPPIDDLDDKTFEHALPC